MIFFLFIAQLFIMGPNSSNTAVKTFEVSLYQPFQQIESQQAEVEFWKNKAAAAPQQFIFKQQLAYANEGLFELTADIEYLKTSEAILTELSKQTIPGKASILRSLARNYITQHRFRAALETLEKALKNGHKREETQLMLIDVYEELGWEENQKELLGQFEEQRDFNYLIRLAKWEDGQGNLDKTIELMKEAEAIALAGKQKARLCWIYSNLGDYYGHAGEIEMSADHYKKALNLNPADWYSTKGLAWIAYANDKDPEGALRILKMLDKTVEDPAIDMLRAEILEYQKEYNAADALNQKIVAQVSQADYGVMYHHFLVHQYAQNPKTHNIAIQMARKEIAERAVPAAYDLLAYVYYQDGKIAQAQEISKMHILDKTFEPGILINQVYYFQNVDLPFINLIKTELSGAAFELGPLTYDKYLSFIQS
jgi:tetratricopeptide (TPR) repeat protein